MADSIIKAPSVELLDMPMLHPESDVSRWRERQFNRLIQWMTRRQARGWAKMMDRQQNAQLTESVRAFRDARAKEAAVKPVLMDDAFRDTIREPVVDGLGEWISAKSAPDDAAILYVPGGAFIMKRSDRMTALAARLARMSCPTKTGGTARWPSASKTAGGRNPARPRGRLSRPRRFACFSSASGNGRAAHPRTSTRHPLSVTASTCRLAAIAR